MNKEKNYVELSEAVKLISIFVMGFIACAVIGNLINGPIPQYSDKGFYIFFYVTIPNLLATVVGLPMKGIIGKIFTLIASSFFIFMALKLYCVDVGDEFEDIGYGDGFSEGADGPLRRTFHFLGTFFYLNMICAVMIYNPLVNEYLEHPFLIFFPLLFFVLYLIIMPKIDDDGSEKTVKGICRLCACISITLGIAGVSVFFMAHQLADEVILPAKMAYGFLVLQTMIEGTTSGVLLVLLIQIMFVILVTVGIVFLCVSGSEILTTITLGSIFVYFLFIEKFHWNGIVYGHDIKYWLLLIAMVTTWSIINGRKGKRYGQLTFCGGMLVFTFTLPCFNSAYIFYDDFVNYFQHLFGGMVDLRMSFSEFVANIFSGKDVVLAIVVVVGVFLLIALVIKIYGFIGNNYDNKDSFVGNTKLIRTCSMAFLIGVLIWNLKLGGFLGYAFCVFPIWVITFDVAMCILKKNKEGLRFHGKGFLITLFLMPVVILFAEILGIILFFILGIAWLIFVVKTLFGGGSDSSSGIGMLAGLAGLYANTAIDEWLNTSEQTKKEHSYSEKKTEVWRMNGMMRENFKVNSSGDMYFDPEDGEWHKLP